MAEFIRYVAETNRIHWGDSLYQWVFYIGIAIILVLEKRKQIRNVFVWLPIIVLACIYSPLFLKVLGIFGVGQYQYVARMFSFIPLVYTMAVGITLLMGRVKGPIKPALVSAVCVFPALTGVNVYRIDWMRPAENLEKVPGDVLEISALFSEPDKRVCIAAPDPLAEYLRQVDARLITPYARDVGELGLMLGAESPDVPEIMKMAGLQSVDFVVAPRSAKNDFKAVGYKPYAQTTNYLVYAVTGVPRYAREINENSQIKSVTFYDATGKKAAAERGYTTICYEYDGNGYVSGESYLDGNGAPFELFGAYSSVRYRNSQRGLVLSKICMDNDGAPVYVSGCAEVRYHYDLFGTMTGESYYDEDGQLTNRVDDIYATKRFKLNGNEVTERYLDTKGEPTLCRAGFAAVKHEYDENHQLKKETYYDLGGTPMLEIGEDAPVPSVCMAYRQMTVGTDCEGEGIVFRSGAPDNRFIRVLFQIYDRPTGQFLLEFGSLNREGVCEGTYINQLPDGMYDIVFKASTTMQDEYCSSLEYLREGEALNYRYTVDDFEENRVAISDFYVGRSNPGKGM